MQKKSSPHSGFLTSRVLIALVLCAAACLILSGTVLAFFRSEAPPSVSHRTLTFAERVAYQRAIEDVYWRHRIWPRNRGDRPDPKPSLDAVMSPAQIEKKVDDYLHKSQALEDYWQRPITAEQLQAEMDRMAKYSRQPEVLRELFDALGNDPFVIAECLARSALAERLLTNWYSYDQRIHGELKQRAQAELLTHSTFEQIKQISANDGEIEFVKIDRFHEETRRRLEHGVELSPCEWDETMQKLAVTFKKPDAAENYQTIPIGKLSSLQEDESRYYVTVVVKKTGDHLKLATVSWPKERLDSWLAKVENQMPELLTAPDASYRLPIISGGAGCDQSKVFLQFRHGPDHYHVRKLAASSWSIPVE